MGIFDSYFNPQTYGGENALAQGLLQRLADWQWQQRGDGYSPFDTMASMPAQGPQMAATAQAGPPLQIAPQIGQQPPQAEPQPMGGLGSLFGGLSDAIAANPMTLMALGAGISQGGFGKGLQMAVPAMAMDRQTQQQSQSQRATIAALKARGVPDADIALAASSPDAMKSLLSRVWPTYTPHNVGGTGHAFNAATGEFRPQYVEPKIEKVQPGESLYQIGGQPGGPREASPIGGIQPAQAKIGDVSEMRKEIGGLPEVKRLAEATPIFRSMMTSASRDSSAADLDFVYGVAKIFDPDSVVREGEMKLVGKAQSIPEDVKGYIKSVTSGEGRLTPAARARILEVAHTRMNELKGGFDARVQPYGDIAKRYNIRPEDVLPTLPQVPEYVMPQEYKLPSQGQPAQGQPTLRGTTKGGVPWSVQ